MPKRSASSASAQSLPRQFEAALLTATPDELRAYLRDLATRQRATRADFLL